MEYFLYFWGGAEEIIKKELNLTDSNFWFQTKEDRQQFLNKLKKYSHLGLALDLQESDNFTHKRTIAKIKLKYNEKIYEYEHNFGYEYKEDDVLWMYEEGNYSCDCNRSLFIEWYCDPDFNKNNGNNKDECMSCGEKIKLISLDIEYR
jgi:hypothetical protein